MSVHIVESDAAVRLRRRHASAERSRARYIQTLWSTFSDPYASVIARAEAKAMLTSRGLLPSKDL